MFRDVKYGEYYTVYIYIYIHMYIYIYIYMDMDEACSFRGGKMSFFLPWGSFVVAWFRLVSVLNI